MNDYLDWLNYHFKGVHSLDELQTICLDYDSLVFLDTLNLTNKQKRTIKARLGENKFFKDIAQDEKVTRNAIRNRLFWGKSRLMYILTAPNLNKLKIEEKYKCLLRLAYKGYTHRQIAENLGISRGSVSTRFRALRRKYGDRFHFR
jgi:DNA-directed RNA polymerase specialized sigma24 family protein